MRVKQTLFVLLFVAILTACGGNDVPEVAAPTVVPSHTPPPSATPIPTLSTPLALLILPSDLDKETSDLYQKTVYDLALASGFRFQVRNGITPEDLADPTLKVVIALPPDPGVANYAPTAPNVQFLAVNIPNLTAGANISVLAPNTQVELPAFLAGYTLAMMVEEFKIGMLYPEGEPNAQAALNAFSNGMRYYCGLCEGIYFDPVTYPAILGIPASEDPAKFGGYANVLINDQDVSGLYIFPSIASDDFLSYVGTQGVYLVGVSRPEPRPGGWLMTISPDTIKAIQTAWPQLIAGQGGQNVQSPLGIADVDTGVLTEAKLRLVRETLDALIAGRILPSNP
ncbi:MAG: hypothetical protein IPP55_09895 [Anaerolineales bacterium]|nr:hypothetical protein [Anaerolineales bacterium]MBK9780346.1 hypothetical protein [Anaerolineales bacterium]